MKALLILAALICVSTALDCASGPSFWCASRANAQQCEKGTYCRENCWSFTGRVKEFWRNHMIKFNRPPDHAYTSMCTNPGAKLNLKGSVCNECKVIIGDLDKMLKNKAGVESLTAAMRFFCNFLPAYSNMCRQVVNDITDVLEKMEPFMRDPEVACENLHMCPKQHENTTHALSSLFQNAYSSEARIGNGTLCDDCQQACHDIIAQLQDPSQQQNIKETFEEVCAYVGPLRNKCLQYVDQFVPQLINWIISRFTDPLGLCTQLGFCR